MTTYIDNLVEPGGLMELALGVHTKTRTQTHAHAHAHAQKNKGPTNVPPENTILAVQGLQALLPESLETGGLVLLF